MIVDVRLAIGASAAVLGLVAVCSAAHHPTLTYQVRVEAPSVGITLLDCAKCPMKIKPNGSVSFVEKRQLPRTYRVQFAHRVITCGPVKDLQLAPTPTTPMAAEYTFVVEPSGVCGLVHY